MINVLHVLDMAGIASILSHFHNKCGYGNSKVIFHKKNNFSYKISTFYGGTSFIKFRDLIKYVIFNSKNFDVIHIHGAEILVPIFKITGKKIVLHYHGSDINQKERSQNIIRIICRSLADLIVYNGKNMEKNIITLRNIPKKYLPNPIDTEHFQSKNNLRTNNLSFVSDNLDKEKTIKSIETFGKTKIVDLDKQQILYSLMPDFLSKFETYVDIKIMPWGYTLPDLSTTALQALSCGCSVYHNGTIFKTLPSEHDPINSIKKLNSFYEKYLIKK